MGSEAVEKVLYSRKDAAYALRIPLRTLAYLIANKKLATRRVGRRVLIPATEVKRFAKCDTFDGTRPEPTHA